jgi:hypothetical protein
MPRLRAMTRRSCSQEYSEKRTSRCTKSSGSVRTLKRVGFGAALEEVKGGVVLTSSFVVASPHGCDEAERGQCREAACRWYDIWTWDAVVLQLTARIRRTRQASPAHGRNPTREIHLPVNQLDGIWMAASCSGIGGQSVSP